MPTGFAGFFEIVAKCLPTAAALLHRDRWLYPDPLTNDLFGYVECESEAMWNVIAGTDVCRRWWRHMRDIMPSNADDSPVSRDLREVFHIERTDGTP